MSALALHLQEGFHGDPDVGDLFVFRSKRGDLVKIIRHDGLCLSLYAKRLGRGRFVWPVTKSGSVALPAAQLS